MGPNIDQKSMEIDVRVPRAPLGTPRGPLGFLSGAADANMTFKCLKNADIYTNLIKT